MPHPRNVEGAPQDSFRGLEVTLQQPVQGSLLFHQGTVGELGEDRRVRMAQTEHQKAFTGLAFHLDLILLGKRPVTMVENITG